MTTQTSEQWKAELIHHFYGIDPKSLLVERVTVTRGGTLTHSRIDRSPSVYRIKYGRPPLSEIGRVFGLTDLISFAPALDTEADGADNPQVAALRQKAADRLRARQEDEARTAITQDQEQFFDHKVVSDHEQSNAGGGQAAGEGTHPLAGAAVAAAGLRREAEDAAWTGQSDG